MGKDRIHLVHEFYARRIKRIIPAATLVLVVTVLGAMLVAPSSVAQSVRIDALAAFFFVSNWRFLAVGTDYFQQDAPPSPLQHYWSLSVEEQFYFVWPWLMLGVLLLLKVLRVRMRWDRRVATIMMLVIVVVSYWYATGQSVAAPTAAYFSSLTRVWELGFGALLACVVPLLNRIPTAIRPALAWIGLAGMTVSLFAISDQSTWPAPWAVLPVVATGLVIAAGTGAPARFVLPLTNPVAGYIGDISYSLYLWHFPLIVLIGYTMEVGPAYYLLTLTLIAIVSVASYHAVEKPIHTSPLGRKFNTKEEKSRAWRTWREENRGSARLAGTALVAVLGLTLATSAMSVGRVSASSAAPPPQASSSPDNSSAVVPPMGTATKALQQRIIAASSLTVWPDFSPSIEEQAKDVYEDGVNACNARDVPTASAACTFGSPSASHTAVIAGDSIAGKWANDLFHLYTKDDWKLVVLSKYGCPFNASAKVPNKNNAPVCGKANDGAASAIRQIKPDLLFISNSHVVLGAATVEEWSNGFEQQLENASGAKKVVVLTPPPTRGQAVDPLTCITPKSSPADCLTYVPTQWRALFNAEWNLLRNRPGGVVVDTRPMFCTQDGRCPVFEGDLLIRRDAYHMADAYMKTTRPAFVELLRGYGVEVPGELPPSKYQPFPTETDKPTVMATQSNTKTS